MSVSTKKIRHSIFNCSGRSTQVWFGRFRLYSVISSMKKQQFCHDQIVLRMKTMGQIVSVFQTKCGRAGAELRRAGPCIAVRCGGRARRQSRPAQRTLRPTALSASECRLAGAALHPPLPIGRPAAARRSASRPAGPGPTLSCRTSRPTQSAPAPPPSTPRSPGSAPSPAGGQPAWSSLHWAVCPGRGVILGGRRRAGPVW